VVKALNGDKAVMAFLWPSFSIVGRFLKKIHECLS
jgi:hypothetical protein